MLSPTDILTVLALSAGIAGAYSLITSIQSFRHNLAIARASGLNYVCRPIFEYNYFYVVIQPLVSLLIELVPASWDPTGYLDFYRKDWRMHCKFAKHAQLGNVYWNVSPRYLMLEIGDADALDEITKRRLDFVKPQWVFENVRLFGENILEAEGEAWRRHRKVIGPRFNEELNQMVWSHAAQLTAQMFPAWTTRSPADNAYSPGKVSEEMQGLGRLALYIIVGAAFGVSIPFSQESVKLSPDVTAAISFAESLHLTISNLITCMIFPNWLLHLGTASTRKLARATDEVRAYMRSELLSEAATLQSEAEAQTLTRHGVVTGLAAAMVPDAAKPAHNQIKFQEAMGNIFLMGLAGSATTADTTHFALVLLALHQDAQDWVLEELDEVMADLGEDAEKWDYKAIFPRLTRIRAVMSETLRLYPVSPVLPKWTADRAQTLHYAGKPLHLPAGTVTVLSFPAVQYNPQYWGADAGEFRPQRWESSGAVVGGVPEGAFAPFSKGARSCLGKRFSESEFVSVLGSVLRRHRVELQVGEGETVQGVQERARSALAGAKTYLTLYVGDDVPLVWKKR